MKDMSLKVKYLRTDTGCLEIFVSKNKTNLAFLTIFPDNRVWLELPKENRAEAYVFPDNALHRVWYMEVCLACGWKSEPFEGVPMGPGGTLNCPECRKAKRNPTLEGCYGNVDAIKLDWETKQPIKEKD